MMFCYLVVSTKMEIIQIFTKSEIDPLNAR